jgi:tetratricopeptide (TPR) repeat protein
MLVSARPFHGTLVLLLSCLMVLTGSAADSDCLREFPAVYSMQTGTAGETREQRVSRTQAVLASMLGMTPEAVGKALAPLVETLRQKGSTAAKIDRARACFIHSTYEEARTLALEAGDEAHRAAPRRPADIVSALQLAAFAAMELSRFEEAVKYLSVALGETSADRDLKAWTQLQGATARSYGLMKMFKDEEQTVRLIFTEHERLLGERDPETIKRHSEYAGLLYQNGRDADAERETRAVLKISEIVNGPGHEQTQVLRKNLARVLEVSGRPAEAETLRRKVITVQMETLGGGAAATLRSREQLVKNLLEQNKFGDAEAEARILAEHSEKVNGPDAITTLGGRISVALAVAHQSRHEQALQMLGPLQADCVRVLGPDHPDSLRVAHAQGTCLNALAKYADAETVLTRVLEARKRVLPVDDLDTLDTQHQLGLALLRQNKLKPALSEIRIVANSYQRLLKPGDIKLAAINQAANEFTAIEEGRQILIEERRAVVEDKARQLGEDHLDALDLRASLAGFISSLGETQASLDEYQKVLSGCLRTLGKKHVGTVDVMQKVAMAQQSLGQFAVAEKSYREVLVLRSALVKAGDVSLEETRYRLGLCIGQAGRLKEAQEIIEASYLAVKDRKDVNMTFVEEMRRVLDQIRQMRVPVPLELNAPGTLQQPVSISKAGTAAPPLIGAPGATSGAPSADPSSLVPAGTIQKPVQYKP